MSEPSGACAPGAFSSGGATSASCSAVYNSSVGCAACAGNASLAAGLCVPGSFSAGGATSALCSPCPAGVYQSAYGARNDTCMDLCPAGYYCGPRSTNATADMCPPGVWGAPGAVDAACTGPCAEGYWCGAGSVSATANACGQGSFCPPASSRPTPCAAGRFGLARNNTAASCDGPCPAGYSCPLGTVVPKPCAPGILCDGNTTDGVTICPGGLFCNNATGPQLCIEGFYCPPGVSNATKLACPPGQYSNVGAAVCSTCAPGTFCPGSTRQLPCEPGSFQPAGSASECLPCPIGLWSDAFAQLKCGRACDAGYYGTVLGATNALGCTICPVNTFSPSAGSSACTKCPDGFSGPAGGTKPCASECAFNEVVDTSGGGCVACPSGLTPDALRTTCIFGDLNCPLGQMLSSVAGTGCTPLRCDAPLAMRFNTTPENPNATIALSTKPVASNCLGCPPGTRGAYPNCSACAPTELCLGPTSVALIDFAAPLPPAFAAACPPLTGPLALAAPRALINTARGFKWLTDVLTVDAAILTGMSSAAAVITLLAVASLARACGGAVAVVGTALDAALAKADLFNMAPAVAEDTAPLRKSSSIGGACTMLALATFATATAVLTLQRAADNVAVARSIDVLSAQNATFAALPFASVPPWGQGIQIRVTASGEPGVGEPGASRGAPGACATPLSWVGAGLDAGTWALLSRGSAPCGAAATSAQLVFSCAACTLTVESTLDIVLPYSCQSLLIEVGALDANGTVTSFALPPEETRGKLATRVAPGQLLEAVEVTVLPLASMLTVLPPVALPSARGYTIAGLTSTSQYSTLGTASAVLAPRALDGTARNGTPPTVIAPLRAAVSLHFKLQLQPLYLNVVVSEKISIAALLSTLVGLSGIVSFFGTLRGLLFVVAPRKAPPAAADATVAPGALRDAIREEVRRAFAAAAAGGRAQENKDDNETRTENPLRAPPPRPPPRLKPGDESFVALRVPAAGGDGEVPPKPEAASLEPAALEAAADDPGADADVRPRRARAAADFAFAHSGDALALEPDFGPRPAGGRRAFL